MRRHPNASPGEPTHGIRRAAALRGCPALALAAVLAVLVAPAASAAGRGYELVSPANKGGDEVGNTPNNASYFTPTASSDGSRVIYNSTDAYPGAEANLLLNSYMGLRGEAGWGTDFLTPPIDPIFGINSAAYNGLSEDLSKGVLFWGLTPVLTPDAPEGTPLLYLEDFDTHTYKNLTPGAEPLNVSMSTEFVGASDDLSHVAMIIWNGGELTPESPAGAFPLLYEWSEETEALSLVGHLPDNSVPAIAVEIARPPGTSGTTTQPFNSVSADGSRIFYRLRPAATDQLYVRIDGTTTKHVSESQATVPDPKGPKNADFRFADSEGSMVFFSSAEKLTDDATTGPNDEGNDLYLYDVDSEGLTDITVDLADTAGAQVQGVVGGAEDGSNLYFVAKGVLATGATAGQNNLYLWTDDGSPKGSIEFIASGVDAGNWKNESGVLDYRIGSRVTADGGHLLFVSTASHTGYPNEGHLEAFLYDAATEEIACATCNPSGTPATANALPVGTGDYSLRARTLSEDASRVFFTTTEQLVVGDNNAVEDTYEYDVKANEVNLISSGKAEIPSPFTDASADGEDVFFTTRQQLVGTDTDDNVDVYDARVGGGLASQNPPPAPEPCGGLACRGETVATPAASKPASSTVDGPGNKKPHHKKHRKKHKGKHGKKRKAARHANRHGNR